MKTYHVLFLLACGAAAVPFVLALFNRDGYADKEGMSLDDWKNMWSRLTARTGEHRK